jgi:aspartate ammonia-lyase
VTIAAAVSAGELELNVMEMTIARRLLAALDEVARVAVLFADRCIDGLTWVDDAVAANLEGSLAGAMAAAAERGYAAAAKEAPPP